MAFFNRASSILRQAASNNINHEISASQPSSFQMIRCMSFSLLFEGLKYDTDDKSLKEAFKKYGDVIDAKVFVDGKTGESRGLGFVIFSDPEFAFAASQAMEKQKMPIFTEKMNYVADCCGYDGYDSDGYGGGGGYGGDRVGYGDGYSWGGRGFTPMSDNYFGRGGGSFSDAGGYGGGGDSFSDAGSFEADGNRENQFGSSAGLNNLGGSDGRNQLWDEQNDYADRKAQ